jgi:hypothetical protein
VYSHKHAVENTEFPEGRRADGRAISESSIKAVLVALANHANDGQKEPTLKNWAWPSNETLAKESKRGISTVKWVLAWARHLRFFKHVDSRQKEGKTTRYLFRDVIEVNGKEMFKGGGSQALPGGGSQELPWVAPQELWGSSLGYKAAAPQKPLPSSPGATDGSLGATKTISNTTNQGFQLKAVRERCKTTTACGGGVADSLTATCAICGCKLDEETGECCGLYAEHLGPVAEEVLSDFVPRYENRPEDGLTLFRVYDSKMNLPVPRPKTIITLYPDNIQGRNNDDCEGVGPEYSIHNWENWFNANQELIILPAGTKEFNLSQEELESYRSSSILDAGLPSDFDLEVAFDFISRVIPEDDPEFQRFWKRVLAEHRELTARVPPLLSANIAAE